MMNIYSKNKLEGVDIINKLWTVTSVDNLSGYPQAWITLRVTHTPHNTTIN